MEIALKYDDIIRIDDQTLSQKNIKIRKNILFDKLISNNTTNSNFTQLPNTKDIILSKTDKTHIALYGITLYDYYLNTNDQINGKHALLYFYNWAKLYENDEKQYKFIRKDINDIIHCIHSLNKSPEKVKDLTGELNTYLENRKLPKEYIDLIINLKSLKTKKDARKNSEHGNFVADKPTSLKRDYHKIETTPDREKIIFIKQKKK